MTRIPAPLRTEALEQLLTERGLVDPAVMEKFIANCTTNVGPPPSSRRRGRTRRTSSGCSRTAPPR